MMTVADMGYKEFINYLEKVFNISLSDVKKIIKNFHSEMKKGLSGFESSLKMIPSFVERPTGAEHGKFLALDLGGTNLRLLAVELDGKGSSTVSAVSKFVIPPKTMTGAGDELFDFVAECISSFLLEGNIDKEKNYDLAFTFSFPVEQTNIAAGKLIVWTKGFTAKDVEGKDVIILLNEALKRKGINCIRIAALANDTVGTLAAKCYNDRDCDMGVILGTGTNACYPEKISKIKKWRGLDPKGEMIINMEWGNFNKLRFTSYDKDVDDESLNTGFQYLEKMVSGMYLGELTRKIIRDLIHRGLLFNNACPKSNASAVFSGQTPQKSHDFSGIRPTFGTEAFIKKDSFLTEDMSLIASDESADCALIDEFLKKSGLNGFTSHDKVALKNICRITSTRAARISAAAICAVIKWMDPKLKNNHTIGIDGSLFEKYPGFSQAMLDVFKKLFKENSAKIRLELAKDGSGKGAAIIAAIAAGSQSK